MVGGGFIVKHFLVPYYVLPLHHSRTKFDFLMTSLLLEIELLKAGFQNPAQKVDFGYYGCLYLYQ